MPDIDLTKLLKTGVTISYEGIWDGKGADRHSEPDPSRVRSVYLGLTPADWCSIAMHEGDAYIGGCCGTASAMQDIESRALWIAEDGVCKALEDAGIRYIHAYSYPDGSLYKYVEVTGTEDETWEKLCALPVWRLGPVRPVERYTNDPPEPPRSTPEERRYYEEEQERLAGLWQHKYGG
jgi:hypothetical protein